LTQDEPTDVRAAETALPEFFRGTALNQTAAQPCYLDAGPIPGGGRPCPKRRQPDFNGHQAFYNTGLIPYRGNHGNHARVTLSPHTAPGDYYFYCIVHGAAMSGFVQVKPPTEKIPDQATLDRRARANLD